MAQPFERKQLFDFSSLQSQLSNSRGTIPSPSSPSPSPPSPPLYTQTSLSYDSSKASSTDSLDGLLAANGTEKRTGKSSKKNNARSLCGDRTLWRRRGRIHRFTLLLLFASAAVASLVVSISMLGMKIQTKKILQKHSNGPRPWQAFPLLMKYYSGILELTSTKENHPENFIDLVTAPIKLEDVNATQTKIAKTSTSTSTPSPIPYSPYPQYDNEEYKQKWKGNFRACVLPDGRTLAGEEGTKAYRGVPSGMPDHTLGSYSVVGLDDDICFERRSRLGPYGLRDRGEESGGKNTNGSMTSLHDEWKVDWKSVQESCVEKNSDRYISRNSTQKMAEQREGEKKHHRRTAFVLRVWHDYEYQPLDYVNLRSLIAELNLLSGGEYDVHLLVHVRNHKYPIWADQEVYDRVVKEHIAEEFRGLVTLWTENMMAAWYPNLSGEFLKLPVHGAYRSIWMPLQYFMLKHPEYDYVWNWELDVRYTGHFYHLLEKLTDFARKQPRRHLWERNTRFYVPKVHGSWENFTSLVTRQEPINGTVWGPVKYSGIKVSDDSPVPPFARPQDDEKSEWGIGEEADLITLNPLFDPVNTTWGLRDDFTGYESALLPQEYARISTSNHTGPPRRAAIITPSRLSRRLVETMHRENAFYGHTMFTEMWPASCALHHGYKAVFAPHPVYFDRKLPARYVEGIFNNGVRGSTGGRPQCVFGREHNFQGSSWYYNAEWPGMMWRRWLGWRWNDIGGEDWEKEHGRMCLRGMLLHPVKDLGA